MGPRFIIPSIYVYTNVYGTGSVKDMENLLIFFTVQPLSEDQCKHSSTDTPHRVIPSLYSVSASPCQKLPILYRIWFIRLTRVGHPKRHLNRFIFTQLTDTNTMHREHATATYSAICRMHIRTVCKRCDLKCIRR